MTDPVQLSGSNQAWQRILEKLRTKLSPQQFETWFAPLSAPTLADDHHLRLQVPNRFYADWLQSNYQDVLCSTVAEVTGSRPSILFEVVPQLALDPTEPPDDAPSLSIESPEASAMLNPYNTFENFVVGPNNRLAHAAAQAVADSPGGAYNPLFIHGGCGLGKTHLLHAVCHHLLGQQPRTRILYVSCEGFLTDFIRALDTAQIDSFRSRYRECDALIVDDIHFLANKERTQEEFFHTFNSLYSQRRQVVLSSDSSPTEIPTLTERLVSRFKWGLVARLDPPDFETRLAIVRRKAAARHLTLGDDVASFVAQRVTSNVRELEGAVIRLVGYASLAGLPLDLSLAEEVLKDTVPRRSGLTIESIQEAVAQAYKLRRTDLVGKRRTKSIAYPRQIAMFLARKLTGHSLDEIGLAFGRDHSTVLYACEKISREEQSNSQLRDMIERLSTQLRRPGASL